MRKSPEKPHWTERVEKILLSTSGDLKVLAKIAGFDPGNFYENQDLSGCDLRGQDLRGMNFSGCNLENAIIDDLTKIDKDFDPRINDINKYWEFDISIELNTMILNYMKEASYTYSAWAYRNLIKRALRYIYGDRILFYIDILKKNKNLGRIVNDKRRVNLIKVRVLIEYPFDNKSKVKEKLNSLGLDGATLLMIGLISRKVRLNSKKDYSNLSANSFYPPKLIKVEGSM